MKRLVTGAIAFSFMFSGLAQAQETDLAGRISIELNAVQTVETSCTLTFLITNGLEAPLDKAVYEAVLFDTSGQVARLTLFDFGTLPPARPRVRQFALPGTTCEGLGRVLLNGAHICDGAGVAEGACDRGLVLSTRTDIEVLG
ncbi:hypothetical protein E4Z66_15095 [Aliishimia ponticola]|uniref:Tat pathway signal sequence domain protein n=1 Tax=Aliishimia ponticola TaxID=2499833 RepID=A0A4S4NAT9_9RHOB|nr:hypothetical protein [Aliishimia ponticola]THH35148.1 hypothetical protein E4Z66_15095 [Aliishimia ponticola]